LDQKLTMSALPQKADMCGATAHVCFGPIADISSFIRSPRSARASSEGGIVRAERPCSFEIDHKLVLSRRLYWQISWLLAFWDAIHIDGGGAKLIDPIGAVRQQPSGRSKATLELLCLLWVRSGHESGHALLQRTTAESSH
jgi:hypothetical protein